MTCGNCATLHRKMIRAGLTGIDYVRRSLIDFTERPERRGVGMTVHFMCPACGGASIAVPAACAQETEIACGSCGNALGTWREFKERARILICCQVSGDEGNAKIVSLDPLAMLSKNLGPDYALTRS